MKSKILSFALFALLLPCLFLVACGHDNELGKEYSCNHEWEIEYDYDSSGAYCKFVECDECDKIKEKTVIVEAVTQTTATINGTGVTAINYKSGNENTTFTLGMTFDDAIQALNTRCASGKNTEFVQSVIDGSAKPGLPLTGDIKLTKNITVGYNGNTTLCFHITDEVTIDLNGYSITQQCGTDGMSGYGLFIVRDGGKLNIIDSSNDEDGKISGVMTAIQINSNASANLYDGTIICDSPMTLADVSEQYFCVWTIATNGGTFNQYGGDVETVINHPVKNGNVHISNVDNYAFASYGTGVFNIYDGDVEGDYNEVAMSQVNDMRS